MNIYGPFDVDPVIARLTAQVPALRRCEGAAELAAVYADPAGVVPAAFVLPADESISSNNYSGVMRQLVRATVRVVYMARNFRRADIGAEALFTLHAIRLAGRQALLRWRPPGCEEMELTEARLLRYDNATVFLMESFATSYRIQVSSS